MTQEKQFSIKIYSGAGDFLAALDPKKVTSKIAFSAVINGGQGELRLTYLTDFDEFTEPLEPGNLLRVSVIDENEPLGRLIYAGEITRVEPYLTGKEQGVEITALGLGSLLKNALYKNGGGYVVNHAAADPSNIAKAVIDAWQLAQGSELIDYAPGSVALTGMSVSQDFDHVDHLDAIEKARGLAPAGWWWRVGPDGLFEFKAKPSAATHAFVIGRELAEVRAPQTLEEIKNSLVLYWGASETQLVAEDAASIADFGRRQEVVRDRDISNLATAEAFADSFLEENAWPRVAPSLVVESGYDIFSIRPGDTCKVMNLRKGSGVVENNMQIVRVSYTQDAATLEIATLLDDFGRAP